MSSVWGYPVLGFYFNVLLPEGSALLEKPVSKPLLAHVPICPFVSLFYLEDDRGVARPHSEEERANVKGLFGDHGSGSGTAMRTSS